MSDVIENLGALQPRVARRADDPSRDEVAGQLASTMGALVETDRLAAASLEGAEHSDSHGRMRTMFHLRDELELAAAALDRAGAHLLKFYFEER